MHAAEALGLYFPTVQEVHSEEPEFSETFPAAQSSQLTRLEGFSFIEDFPVWHSMQTVEPTVEAYLPLAQSEHSEAEVMDIFPAKQASQEGKPSVEAFVPTLDA